MRNADFGLQKQISECERRILECENRYLSAKALPQASRRIFFAGPSGRIIFSPEITAGNFFFCEVFLPPPHKNQMVTPLVAPILERRLTFRVIEPGVNAHYYYKNTSSSSSDTVQNSDWSIIAQNLKGKTCVGGLFKIRIKTYL